ncbi:MAG TPA: RNA methyltransferase [Bryobacteraceae bacterium]|nr:RNA methyltransferase [Bryobacteraceae bacterium]
MVEFVTSAANPLLKEIRRAVSQGGLTRQGWCIAESFHLLDEALRSGRAVEAIVAAQSALDALEARNARVRTVAVPDALFQSISATENAQGVMALLAPPQWEWEQLLSQRALLLILDGVQDPGNAGTMLRAAEAFGASGAIFLKGAVSPYNPKTLRASAGSIFRVPLLNGMDASVVNEVLRASKARIYAAAPYRNDASSALTKVDLTESCALAIGNEARGLSAEMRSAAREISIPTAGVESLNAAMAASILLYEARRQRSLVA